MLFRSLDMRAGWIARAPPALTDRPARLERLIAALGERLGLPVPPDIPKLTERDRQQLR